MPFLTPRDPLLLDTNAEWAILGDSRLRAADVAAPEDCCF
jgi:hypothetical protein